MSREQIQAFQQSDVLYDTISEVTLEHTGEILSRTLHETHSNGTGRHRQGVYSKRERKHMTVTESSFGRDIEGGIPSPGDPRAFKNWNRQIAGQLPPARKARLIKEHGDLVKKKFSEGTSRREDRRLTLIEWELDRMEDAELGDQLDLLEAIVSSQEEFALHVKNTVRSHAPALNSQNVIFPRQRKTGKKNKPI